MMPKVSEIGKGAKTHNKEIHRRNLKQAGLNMNMTKELNGIIKGNRLGVHLLYISVNIVS